MTTLKDYCIQQDVKIDYTPKSKHTEKHFKTFPVIVPQEARYLFHLPSCIFITQPNLYYIKKQLPNDIILTRDMVNYLGVDESCINTRINDKCLNILTRRMQNITFVDSDDEDDETDDETYINQHPLEDVIVFDFEEGQELDRNKRITTYDEKFSTLFKIDQEIVSKLSFHEQLGIKNNYMRNRYKTCKNGTFVIMEEDGEYSDYDAEPIAVTTSKKEAKKYIRNVYKILLSTSFDNYKHDVRVYNTNLCNNRFSTFPKYYISQVPCLDEE